MKKPFLTFSVLCMFFLSSCASFLPASKNDNSYGSGEEWKKTQHCYEETDAEKEISYPYDLWCVWRGRFCKIHFVDSAHLTFTVPDRTGETVIKFKYDMRQVVTRWIEFPYSSEQCAIVLSVVNEADNWHDRMELRLPEVPQIENALDNTGKYFKFYSHDKTYIRSLSNHNNFGDPDWIRDSDRLLKCNFPYFNMREKARKEAKKKQEIEHGNDWLKR